VQEILPGTRSSRWVPAPQREVRLSDRTASGDHGFEGRSCTGDPLMFNYAWKGEEARTTGIYSAHKAKQIAWTRHYAGFWNESMAFCETQMPSFISRTKPDFRGPSPDLELRYYRAVTGKKDSFADTMEIGRKIWNMERAIRVAQGRHRDQEKFAPFHVYAGRFVYDHVGRNACVRKQ